MAKTYKKKAPKEKLPTELTKEELEVLQNIVKKLNNGSLQVGNLEIQKASLLNHINLVQQDLANFQNGLKEKYGSSDRYWNSAVFLDSSYLRFPSHQTVQVLPDKWTKNIFEQAQLADYLSIPSFEHKYVGYSDIEVQKIKRIWDWRMATWEQKEEQVRQQRYNFGKFFQEHDKRRGTDFCKTFPELADFYNDCLRIKL